MGKLPALAGLVIILALVLSACASAGSSGYGTPGGNVPVTGATPAGGAGGYGGGTSSTAAAPATGSAAVTVAVANNPKLGNILVDQKGVTLYINKKDVAGAGTTVCTSSTCVSNWPAVTVASGASATAGNGVTGKLANFTRSDGTTQVTYNGMPLYYFKGDKAPGDANGQGIGSVWYAATP